MQNGNPTISGNGRRDSRPRCAARASSAADATHQAYGRLAMMMQQQASALAFRDVVAILAVVVVCLIPLAFVMKKPAEVLRDAPPPH